MKLKLKLNDQIFWFAADGYHEGKVIRTYRGPNAAQDVIDWVSVEFVSRYEKKMSVSMPNTDSYLQMMKVGVL